MNKRTIIDREVHKLYWQDNLNCARTTLKILSKIFKTKLNSQVIHSAIGFHGAGRYGAQCGLVEGTIMLIGIIGHNQNFTNEQIVKHCYNFAKKFEQKFGSLQCKVLRPEGFLKNNPPHLCEEITKDALLFSSKFIGDNLICNKE